MEMFGRFFQRPFYRREGSNPQTGGGLVREIRTKKNNGPKNMEVTDFIQYKLPQIDVRCSSFVHKNLRFFPRNKKVGLLRGLWGAHHHPPINGALLDYLISWVRVAWGRVVLALHLCKWLVTSKKRCFAGIRTKIIPRAGRDFANLNISVYIIFIYMIYQAYTLYIIYFFCIYICIERFQESRSLVQYICSTMLEGLQKELQWVLKSAL